MWLERRFRETANRFFFREPLRSRELAHCAESDAMQFGTMVGYLTIDESSDQPTTRAAATLQDLEILFSGSHRQHRISGGTDA